MTSDAPQAVREVLIYPHNHFDPTWRRPFRCSGRYHGTTVRGYAEIEAHCFEAWLALTPRGYPFSEGQAVVLREYLARHPARKADLQRHAADGLFDVMLAGETVQDTALSSAEGLVRNFLVAMPLYRDLVGAGHPALKVAWLEDAFGNSPNYPQVLRGVGADACAMLSYRPLPEHVWVGIDGTKLPCLDRHPAGFAGGFAKHAPCPACRGVGCAECAHTGLLFVDGFDLDALRGAVAKALETHSDSPWVVIRLLTEEIRPDARVADLIDALNREYAGRVRIRFANLREIRARMQPVLAQAQAERDDQPSADLNPAMPGCMVSRIRCKQRTRAVAYHLLAAEATLATAAWRAGRPEAPPAEFAAAWRHVTFNQFHDAITGTHVDCAHGELMEMLDAAEAVAARHLPLRPRRARLGPFRPLDGQATLRIGQLELDVDRIGILGIRCAGRDLFGPCPPPFNNRRRRWRIAELTLEGDFGDAWGKRISPGAGLDEYLSVPLGDYHTRVVVSPRAVRWTGRYTGGDRLVRRLAWTQTVSASADGRRLEFRTDVDWDTRSRRLRVQIPVAARDPVATYEVPFGFIDRTFDAAKLDYSQWNAHQMEFPTLHWVRKRVGADADVVLFNKGLPCNRWSVPPAGEGGMLDLSLVRSPEWAFCAVEPGSYEFWDIDGQRDAGRHTFEYALFPCAAPVPTGDLVRLGYAYNLPAPLEPPFAVEGDVVVTAWKRAEDGSGWILRLQEAGGSGTPVRLRFPDGPRRVAPTNLVEEPQAPAVCGTEYVTPLHRHGILTLHIS